VSEALTRLERVEADVEKAQAALGLVEGVLHTAVNVQATARDSRKLLRTVSILVVVGAVVALGVVVIVSLRSRPQREVRHPDVDVK
jgi:hypothetical protein